MAVAEERETERDRHTPWRHREVQRRVAEPSVQLRFISPTPHPQFECGKEAVSKHTKVLLISLISSRQSTSGRLELQPEPSSRSIVS